MNRNMFCRMMPESLRWLISQGRTKEAERNVHRIAEVNKKIVTPDMLMLIDKEVSFIIAFLLVETYIVLRD